MKNGIVKNMIGLLSLVVITAACGTEKSVPGQVTVAAGLSSGARTAEPVTLVSRYNGGDYVTATYSFRHLTRDNEALTRNNWELLFEARADFEDYFKVDTVVDDNSFIYDLGERSCVDIKSTYPDDRKKRPLVWLGYSDADPSERVATKTAKVKVGHCYLTYNNDEDGRVVALFRVQAHEKSKTVTIGEIEVLDVSNR